MLTSPFRFFQLDINSLYYYEHIAFGCLKCPKENAFVKNKISRQIVIKINLQVNIGINQGRPFNSINLIHSYHHNHQLPVFIPHDHYPAFHAKNNLNYLLLKRIAKGGDQNNQQHEKEGFHFSWESSLDFRGTTPRIT